MCLCVCVIVCVYRISTSVDRGFALRRHRCVVYRVILFYVHVCLCLYACRPEFGTRPLIYWRKKPHISETHIKLFT